MKRWLPWIALAAAVAAIGALTARADDTGEALDPRSSGPLGARGLVLLLEEMGARVTIGPDAPGVADGHHVALLLVDDLGRAQQERLRAWVEGGGTLVVADPLSDFVPALDRTGGTIFDTEEQPETLRPGCGLAALRDVREIHVPRAAMYRVREGATACFSVQRDARSAYLVARSVGRGTVVALGGGAPFVNDRLDDADNAVLAVALGAPVPATRVTILEADIAGSGDEGLLDLVPAPVRRGLWQLAAGFVAVMLWAGRRLGRPIEESQPVDIAGSELVAATGNLLHHAARRDAAAAMLRHQLRRDVASRYGVALDAPADDVIAVLTARGIEPDVAHRALVPNALGDDDELIAVASTIESIRREVTHA